MRDEIHRWILSSRYGPGDKLPLDKDIAVELGCARSTVVRAMQDLTQTGLIERRRKGGTQVRHHRATRAVVDIPVHRVAIESQGARYDHRLLSQETHTPPDHIAQAMRLGAMADCLHVRAVHLADDRPYIYENRWIACTVFAGHPPPDFTTISANEWLVAHCPYDDISVSFSAVSANRDLAETLASNIGNAHFCVERCTWSQGQPITMVTSFFHAGYRLNLQ